MLAHTLHITILWCIKQSVVYDMTTDQDHLRK